MSECANTHKAFSVDKYPRDSQETLMFFLKRYNYVIDLIALNTKARA